MFLLKLGITPICQGTGEVQARGALDPGGGLVQQGVLGSGVDVGSRVVGIALGADADDPATDDEGPAGVAMVGGACDTGDLGGGGRILSGRLGEETFSGPSVRDRQQPYPGAPGRPPQ